MDLNRTDSLPLIYSHPQDVSDVLVCAGRTPQTQEVRIK